MTAAVPAEPLGDAESCGPAEGWRRPREPRSEAIMEDVMKIKLANLGIALTGQLAIAVLVILVPPREIMVSPISTTHLWPKLLLTASMVLVPLVVFPLRRQDSERTSIEIVKGAVVGPGLALIPLFLVFNFLGGALDYVDGGDAIASRFGAALIGSYLVCLIALVAGGLVASGPVTPRRRRHDGCLPGEPEVRSDSGMRRGIATRASRMLDIVFGPEAFRAVVITLIAVVLAAVCFQYLGDADWPEDRRLQFNLWRTS